MKLGWGIGDLVAVSKLQLNSSAVRSAHAVRSLSARDLKAKPPAIAATTQAR